MVEILRRGTPKSERVFTVTCRECNSELRFKEKEAKKEHDLREGTFLRIDCPVCNFPIRKQV